jgi:hypothetical protein
MNAAGLILPVTCANLGSLLRLTLRTAVDPMMPLREE